MFDEEIIVPGKPLAADHLWAVEWVPPRCRKWRSLVPRQFKTLPDAQAAALEEAIVMKPQAPWDFRMRYRHTETGVICERYREEGWTFHEGRVR